MRILPFLLMLFVSGLASAMSPSTTHSEPNPSLVLVSQGRDQFAQARFAYGVPDPSNPNNTISTLLDVVVNNEADHAPGAGWTPMPQVGVFLEQCSYTPGAPSCPNLIQVNAQGSALSFVLSRDLSSAELEATVAGRDAVSGDILQFSVHLTWMATGPLHRSVDASHTMEPPSPDDFFLANVRGVDDRRDAQATGSISIGSINYTPFPSRQGFVGRSQGGVITVSRAGGLARGDLHPDSGGATARFGRATWGGIKSIYR